jgi:hypothetical protein
MWKLHLCPLDSICLKVTGANRRAEDMAQLCLSTMLRVGSNKDARRFRSSLDNARCAGKGRRLGIRAGSSDQWGEWSFNFEAVIGGISHEATVRASVE